MEGGKQSGSSLASDLFGAKDSSSAAASSSGILNSMFPPPPKVVGRDSFQYSVTEKKFTSENPSWTAKNGVSDKNGVGGGEGQKESKDGTSYYSEKYVQPPSHYSSSIYYGGQEFYSTPHTAHNPETTFNKDSGEDDPGSASRGNWWQGSLYY